MSDASEAELRRKQADLTSAYENIQLWGVKARSFDDAVEETRLLAHTLASEIAPLRSALQHVRQQHTPTTWTGNAATQSRRRLDTHEERCAAAIRSTDHLIDDLEIHALAAASSANAARTHQSSATKTAWILELELGRLADVLI